MSTTLRQRMHLDLQLAGIAEAPRSGCLRALRQLAAHFWRPPDQITEHDMREDVLCLMTERQYKHRSMKIAASGIIFVCTHTVTRDWQILRNICFPRPKTLPDVLSIPEVRCLIDAVRTPHNESYFWTGNSVGLRLKMV